MPKSPKPDGAIFEPRSITDNRRVFGQSHSRLLDRATQSPQEGAAEFQHAVANRIREHLLRKKTSLSKFCKDADLPAGLSYERFQRIGRGETMMTFTDLMFWAKEIPDLYMFVGSVLFTLTAPESGVDTRLAPPEASF